MENKGKVWLVGAGPGDAGLLTRKGEKVLKDAQVVVYDKLVGPGILSMIPEQTQCIYVGKDRGNHPVPQERINEILIEEGRKGKRVVRLKGGDSFLFGRGGEELEGLKRENIPFEVVPGITSAIGVPAYNGIPVTHRDFCSSLHLITGHTKKEAKADIDFKSLVKLKGTLVFLMGVSSLEYICQSLMDQGMDENMPAAVLEQGTRAKQRRITGTLLTISKKAREEKVKSPAIIIVGRVCALSEEFHWAEDRELGGITIGVTRPKDRPSTLATMLEELGAEVRLLPTIKTKIIQDNPKLSQAILNIGDYQWVGFTSPVGVESFFYQLAKMKKDIRSLGTIKFAAIGIATKKAIESYGILVEATPRVYSGRELGLLLGEKMKRGETLLLPRAKEGAKEIIKVLEAKSIRVEDIPTYETSREELRPFERYTGDEDFIAFTSGSTVENFTLLHPNVDYTRIKALCIGEQTSKKAQSYGMEVYVAKEATMESMVERIKELKG